MVDVDTAQSELIRDLMGDEFAQDMIVELGLQGVPPETQADVVAMVGRSVMNRVVLEILKQLPTEERATFESLMDGGNIHGLRAFLLKHIPDLEEFIRHEASREYETIKSDTHRSRQGVPL